MERLVSYTSNQMAIFHHVPMPMVMNHGLGFQDSTRLHFKSKSKSDSPYSFLYSATLQDSRVSTLISLSYKWVFSEFSPFSLLSSDFKISPFLFLNKPSPLLLYIKDSKSFSFLHSTGLLVAVTAAS